MNIISRKVVFTCPIFKVEERTVEIKKGSTEKHWVVIRQPNVTTVALTNDKNIVLIKETRGKNSEETVELPGGKLKKYNPTILEARKQALSELRTETGFKAKNIQLLEIYEPVSNWRERKYYHFAAWNLSKSEQKLEDGEKIKPHLVSVQKAEKIVQSRSMSFGDEALAIGKALMFFKKKRLI